MARVHQIPGRNPLSYCRLCLSQVNVLTVLESARSIRQPEKELLQKLFHYTRITFNNEEDYPSAVCRSCKNRFNDFHEFRRMVVRNHNAVNTFRRMFGDEVDAPQSEEEGMLIEMIDDAQLVQIKQEEEDDDDDSKTYIPKAPETMPTEEIVKEVDVYHVDGELRTVVVKEEKLSPVRSLPAAPSSANKDKNQDAKTSAVLPHVNILNKELAAPKRPQTVLNPEHSEKRAKLATCQAFSIVKCSQCRAVFRSRENLTIHERNDHRSIKTIAEPSASSSAGSSKSPPQSTHVTLFKCADCSSRFIHEANFEEHVKTCKAAILAKLNPQITVKRTTPAVMNEVVKTAVTKLGGQAQIKQVLHKVETEDQRIRCHYCPLTYKTKYYLKKHMLDTHKIDDYEDVFYCHVCKLNYSCNEDLQLHNRAIHRFQCKQCLEDFRTCMHSQTDGRPDENGVNKGTLY